MVCERETRAVRSAGRERSAALSSHEGDNLLFFLDGSGEDGVLEHHGRGIGGRRA